MAYIREGIVEKALIVACEARGGIAYKLTVQGRRNVPDRLLIMPGGRMIFVECKAPGVKPRPPQRREIDRLRALGCECYVLDSTDCDWIFDGYCENHDPNLNYEEPTLEKLARIEPRKTTCNSPDCNRLRYAFGLCLRHWREYKLNGKI